MTSLQTVRRVAENVLMSMNLNAIEVNILEFDTSGNLWKVSGQFQNGFLGDMVRFEGTFDPSTNNFTKFKVSGRVV